MERGPAKLKLTIYGQAAGAGSKTAEVVCRGKGRSKTPVLDQHGNFILRYRHATKGTEEWMATVAKEARIAWRGLPPLDGALWIDITAFEKRPDAHFYADGRLKPSAPAYPHRTMTHDSGKLRRAIEDSLTADPDGKHAAVWVDDKRVVDGHDRKRYCNAPGEEPRAIIVVGRMLFQTVADAGIASPAPPGQVALV